MYHKSNQILWLKGRRKTSSQACFLNAQPFSRSSHIFLILDYWGHVTQPEIVFHQKQFSEPLNGRCQVSRAIQVKFKLSKSESTSLGCIFYFFSSQMVSLFISCFLPLQQRLQKAFKHILQLPIAVRKPGWNKLVADISTRTAELRFITLLSLATRLYLTLKYNHPLFYDRISNSSSNSSRP